MRKRAATRTRVRTHAYTHTHAGTRGLCHGDRWPKYGRKRGGKDGKGKRTKRNLGLKKSEKRTTKRGTNSVSSDRLK